jgi:hypothetical protein
MDATVIAAVIDMFHQPVSQMETGAIAVSVDIEMGADLGLARARMLTQMKIVLGIPVEATPVTAIVEVVVTVAIVPVAISTAEAVEVDALAPLAVTIARTVTAIAPVTALVVTTIVAAAAVAVLPPLRSPARMIETSEQFSCSRSPLVPRRATSAFSSRRPAQLSRHRLSRIG